MTTGPAHTPLSFAQQRLWLLDQILPHGAVYNIGQVIRLRGDLDVPALQAALRGLVQRHAALRTHFVSAGGAPQQQIEASADLPLRMHDVSGGTVHDAHAFAEAEIRAAFDLGRGPLVRAMLIRHSPDHHWLVLTLHHIVTDGWSTGIIRRELSALYHAARDGTPASLPALTHTYADYAVWQRERLQGAVLARQLAYWRSALEGLPDLELPLDHPRPHVGSFAGRRADFVLEPALVDRLKALARNEGATLFMVLLAAFEILLARYSGQDDFAIGVPTAGRTRVEFEGLVGFFINTLVLRADVSGDPSFIECLKRVKNRALDAHAHQEIPFERLVEDFAPQRDLSRNPLFQVAFALDNTPATDWGFADVAAERIKDIHTQTAKFDLLLGMTQDRGALASRLEYATDLFEAATIETMVRHFRTLLEDIVARPGLAIAELSLLGQEERDAQIVKWNATARELPEDARVHALIEAQARRTPDAVALRFEDRTLTYVELDARANQLARYLVGLGAGPGAPVGICLERSIELVVGLLGILKAGAAYLPLDPAYPEQRLSFMLADGGVQILLAMAATADALPGSGPRIVRIDRDWDDIARQDSGDVAPRGTPQDIAYIIYTSGSTGIPKGVAVEHGGLVNYLSWLQQTFPLATDDCVLQSTPTSFDISVLELFWPLTAGASVAIAAPDAHRTPRTLLAFMQRLDVSHFQVVPSMLSALLDEAMLGNVESLKRVFTAGESLGVDLVRRFHAQTPAELVNGYGPTETTVYSTFWRCRRDHAARSIPIGRPVANTTVYVLDARRRLLPVGVPGELYIGGRGVARGYWNRPELTAQRFIPDPFADDRIVYRTGDRVRWLPDGGLEYLGRLDRQVKLRGFRIELGEVEAALAQLPNVRQAVVHLREDVPGDPRLVAYFVRDGDSPSGDDLRRALERQLPSHMVPAAFIPLVTMPLTPNGKIDHKSLPRPEYESRDVAREAPRTPIEQVIADVWQGVLHLDAVGIDDDFFQSGGHSLLAVQLLSRVNRALDVELSLRQLFEIPTVRGLAMAALEELVAQQAVQPNESTDPENVDQLES
ncbi:MAG: amino acid adenylation domain-containing protein [Casimicrobiaceae bacterium]